MRRAATSLQVQPGQPFGQPAVLGRLLLSLRVGQQLRSLDVASRVWPTQKKTNVPPVNGTKCANTSRRCKYMYVCGCLPFFPPGYSCKSAFAHVHANRRSTLFFLPVCVVCGVCSFFHFPSLPLSLYLFCIGAGSKGPLPGPKPPPPPPSPPSPPLPPITPKPPARVTTP